MAVLQTETMTVTPTTALAAPPQILPLVTIRDLRNAIPGHCFKPSTLRSFKHVAIHSSLASALALVTYTCVPVVPFAPLRWALWATYAYVQGLIFTGIWIIAHECGHGALFPTNLLNDSVGFVLHSALLVPYWSWKYSHARHHRYTNHMEKDTAFVPHKEGQLQLSKRLAELMGHAEDAPAYSFAVLAVHQLLGWPTYLFMYVTSGPKSTPDTSEKESQAAASHFDPTGRLWTSSQRPFILLSTLGVVGMLVVLYKVGTVLGFAETALLYGLPYMWVNNWIVAITYLHHTHPTGLHYEATTWNFVDGQLSTVDRPFGFIGKHLLHGIIDFHVVHHFFTRIPFYHAEEATNAIIPVLGPRYKRDETPFWLALWKTFTSCHVVGEIGEGSGVLEWKMGKGKVLGGKKD